jgi:phage repressor protein C with HTH and peptisase S24 domain
MGKGWFCGAKGQPRYVDPSSPDALKRIGSGIAAARRAHGLSQLPLERLSGVDQTTISRLEYGLAPGIRLERLARIAAALRRVRPARRDPPAEAEPSRPTHGAMDGPHSPAAMPGRT